MLWTRIGSVGRRKDLLPIFQQGSPEASDLEKYWLFIFLVFVFVSSDFY